MSKYACTLDQECCTLVVSSMLIVTVQMCFAIINYYTDLQLQWLRPGVVTNMICAIHRLCIWAHLIVVLAYTVPTFYSIRHA